MPSSAKHFFLKNRSQASLSFQDSNQTRPPQASPLHSPLPSPAYSPYAATSAASLTTTASTPRDGDDDYRFHPANHLDESRRSQSQFAIPTRSQSQRSPPTPAHYYPQPTTPTTIQPNHHHFSSSFPDGVEAAPAPAPAPAPAVIEVNPDFYYRPPQPTAAPKDGRKKGFFRLGLTTKEPANNNSGGVNAPKVGRSISVRRKPTATENGGRQRWSALLATPTSEEEEVVEVDRVGLGLDPSRVGSRANLPGPPLPEKDPTPSARPPPHQGFPARGASLSGPAVNTVLRPPLERQGSSSNPSWGNPVPAVPEYESHPEAHYHRPPSHLPSPTSATSTASYPLLSRGPSELYPSLYHESTSRPASQQSFAPPSPLQPNHPGREEHRPPSHRGSLHPTHIAGSMGPPAHQLPQRSGTNELASLNPGNREVSAYPPYSQGSQGPSPGSGPPPTAQFGGQLGINPPGGSYRGGPQSSPMAPQPSGDGGRTSPSSRSYDDMLNMDVAQVVTKYYELRKPIFYLLLLLFSGYV